MISRRGLTAAACVLLLLALVVQRRPSEDSAPTGDRRHGGSAGRFGSYLQLAGVQPRDYDEATDGLRRDDGAWVLGDVDLALVRVLSFEPHDLDTLAEADPAWIPAQTWKLRHGGASDFAVTKEHCAARFLVGGGTCATELSVVVERKNYEEGRVAYARPTLPEEADEECRAYAECAAKFAWLGRAAPLPAGDSRYHAFRVGDIRLPVSGTKADWQETLQADVELARRNLAALRGGAYDQNDPRIRQAIELEQDILEQAEWMLSL